jgi:hypothetical protein
MFHTEEVEYVFLLNTATTDKTIGFHYPKDHNMDSHKNGNFRSYLRLKQLRHKDYT